MLRTLCLLALTLLTFSPILIAQAPNGINYQAVARNSSGDILVNQSLTVRLTIKESGPVGTTVYQETHNKTTSDFGLFSLIIGQGSVSQGNFSNIDWGGNSHFLQVEIDPGSGYVDLGTTQFVSVPYALYAEQSGSGGGSYQAGSGIDISGNTISNTAPDQTVNLTGTGGTSVSGTYPNFTITSGNSPWNTNAAGIHYTNGSVGIGNNLPLKTLHVDGGGVLFGADTTGSGTRFRWIPGKNALRSGEVDNSSSSVWDWDSIGHASMAHGENVLASGGSSVAFGSNVRSRGLAAYGAGFGVVADGDYAYARGATVHARGQASQASGLFANALGDYTLALGTYDTATQEAAIAIGYVTAADGENAIAIGTETRAIGNGALAIGDGAKSLVGTSTAIGYGAWATDFAALSVGRGTEANAEGSLAIGLGAKTEGNYSYSIGWNTLTSDVNGVALGTYDTAGEQATAIGFYSSATGQGAIGIGRVSRATGTDAIAIGEGNRATGNQSLAMGNGNDATGRQSIAIGTGNESSAFNSFGFGLGNTVSGLQSIALGSRSEALGTFTVAVGDGALAKAQNSMALGFWNVGVGSVNATGSNTALLEIGNGAGSGFRSNALTLLKNGRMGLGTTSPQELLHITGGTVPSIRIDNLEIGALTPNNLGLDGDLVPYSGSVTGYDLGNNTTSEHWDDVVANDFITFSDVRLKEQIEPIQYGLEEILALNPRQYRLSSEVDIAQDERMGLIAQELQVLMPELVVTEDVDRDPETGEVTRKPTDYMGVKYMELIPVLIKALQEEHEKVEALEERLSEMERILLNLE